MFFFFECGYKIVLPWAYWYGKCLRSLDNRSVENTRYPYSDMKNRPLQKLSLGGQVVGRSAKYPNFPGPLCEWSKRNLGKNPELINMISRKT